MRGEETNSKTEKIIQMNKQTQQADLKMAPRGLPVRVKVTQVLHGAGQAVSDRDL